MISLILAIIGIVISFLFLPVGIILLIASLVFGIIGMKKKEKYTKAATIISSIGLAVSIIVLIVGIAIAADQYNKTKEKIDAIWEDVEETK